MESHTVNSMSGFFLQQNICEVYSGFSMLSCWASEGLLVFCPSGFSMQANWKPTPQAAAGIVRTLNLQSIPTWDKSRAWYFCILTLG